MTRDTKSPPIVLTIAGFDPSGGAGIVADIKTFVRFGCRPVAAITSLTFQNSAGVFGVTHETAASLRAQLLPVVEEHRIAAVKIGMLPTAEMVLEVARLIAEADLPAPVVDPVLRSTSGYQLIEEDAIEALRSELMPLAYLITPNIAEAEKLAGLTITSEDDMSEAARKLRELGARAVLIKGGHLKQGSGFRGQGAVNSSIATVREGPAQAIDVLDDEGHVTVFRGEWIDTPSVRGTGCMLSSAIAACLGRGMTLEESVRLAKQFVADAIRDASK